MQQISHTEKCDPDPVLSSCELELKQVLYPFGYPLQLESNSADVIAAAMEAWGAYEPTFDAQPVRLCVGVKGCSIDPVPLDSIIRSRENLMSIVAGSENFITCDFNSGFAFGWVTQDVASDHPLLRYRFLTAAGATLVEQRAFTALHGALISRSGCGLMLAGDSFAGKSTLAYACARMGWTYVSDDAAYFVRDREDRYAAGESHSIRFRPDAPTLFPELAPHLPSVRPNGKIAIEIRTRDLDLSTASGCHVHHVVYLNREAGRHPANLRRITAERALADWSKYNVFGTAGMRDARRRCHKHLLSAQLWELRYSHLDDAVGRLNRLVDLGA